MSGKSWREPVLVIAGLSIMVAVGITVPPWLETREIQQAVAAGLADPEAARFRNIRKVESGFCGEVNGKNRFGAYVGFEPFYARKSGEKWRVYESTGIAGEEIITLRCGA